MRMRRPTSPHPRSGARVCSAAAALTLAVALTACADDDDPIAQSPEDDATEAPSATAAASGNLDRIREDGRIVIGVKHDQPNVGELDPATNEVSGFDIEIAEILAEAMGIEDDNIEFKETVSANREAFIQAGTVDLVVASYSITDDRREVVGQAGPYYVTGQQLLVREDETEIQGPDDLEGKSVCSVTGSTSIKTIAEEYGADPKPFSTYTECVQQLLNESVDAVTTDGAILLGYAARQPGTMKVVGEPFSDERYGVGFPEGDQEMCDFLREALMTAFEDGSWASAFEDTLGEADVETPEPPELDSDC